MNPLRYLIAPLLLLLPGFLLAQADQFVGTWQMESVQQGKSTVWIELQIGTPEKNILYPAEMRIQCDSFSGTYHLLLVKRNIRQLAIGRNKIASSETPFSIGNWTVPLNGIFDFSRDNKGNSFLTAERMFAKHYGVDMPELNRIPEVYKTTAIRIRDFLAEGEISMKRNDPAPLVSAYADSILVPGLSKDYYGIIDPVSVKTKDGRLSFGASKKDNNGVVSVVLNGNAVIDLNNLLERKPVEDIKLDTGLNILVLFADEYGKSPAATGELFTDLTERKFMMSFGNKNDVGANFIVAKIYYSPGKDEQENNAYAKNFLRELSEEDLQHDIKLYHYPDPEGKNLLKDEAARIQVQQALTRDAKTLGNVKTTTRQIILALWDDAVEDGDTISLNINGNWIVQGFPVKKRPQFIAVTIEPGQNKIVFIANNLGSIPPNTAVLEIIDNRQRKSFMIDTDLSQNNLINILYEAKPDL